MTLRPATLLAPAVALAACASYPVPVQRLADAEASSRSATEVGATSSPQAQLHLTMAREEIAEAKKLMSAGDNEKADYVLLRARGDADLALALTRETEAEASASEVAVEVAKVQARFASTTVTTSATTRTTVGGAP